MPLAAERTVRLPGGYVDSAGIRHRDAALRALRGSDQDWMASLPAGVPEPVFVTELLARSVRRIDSHRGSRKLMRKLTIGDRDYLLLQIGRLTFGSTVDLVLTCPNLECGARMHAAFELDAVDVESAPSQPFYVLPAAHSDIRFRLPAGEDQEAAAGWTGMEREEKRLRFLARCVLPSSEEKYREDPSACAALAGAMEKVAPKVEIEFQAACPECGGRFTTDLDPARWLLGELRRGLRDFEREVHLLSFHYHWPIRQILAMPLARRVRWVAMLLREMDRPAPWAKNYA
jgi:hypothetical protein